MTPLRNAAPRRRSGLTLIELLVALGMSLVLIVAMSFAFSAEFSLQRRAEAARAQFDETQAMEAELTQTIGAARLSGIANDSATFFQSQTDSGATDLGASRITFTSAAPGVPFAALSSSDDFETQQTAHGPVGGLAEISFGTVAVGDAGSKSGLFERIQRPSDSDPTQGGTESLIDGDIDDIGFQFWDGSQWQPAWDTTTMTSVRLPQAVQVSYKRASENDAVIHQFAVAVAASDVNAFSPVSTGAVAGTATGR